MQKEIVKQKIKTTTENNNITKKQQNKHTSLPFMSTVTQKLKKIFTNNHIAFYISSRHKFGQTLCSKKKKTQKKAKKDYTNW